MSNSTTNRSISSEYITKDPSRFLSTTESESVIVIHIVSKENLQQWLSTLNKQQALWVESNHFQANKDEVIKVADADGKLCMVALGVNKNAVSGIKTLAKLTKSLPAGQYKLVTDENSELLSIGWALAQYQFDEYLDNGKGSQSKAAVLEISETTQQEISAIINGVILIRKLVSTPTCDMGPSHLSDVMSNLANAFNADFKEILDEELLEQGFNTIHAVGRAAENRPRLLELNWGPKEAPKLTLVGKGVCFDTGGLDIKPTSGMRIMKKDMGGAAHTLGIAQMIMAAKLNVRLRLLIPAVENNISANAFRPGDIITSYKGTTVEVDNTDAEGRLVLSDALALASEEHPDLLIDFATLTGAARVAMGLEMVPFFTDNDDIANGLMSSAADVDDPLWRMPLFEPYASQLKSNFADMRNMGSGPYGGAIVAALFLKHFVTEPKNWVHFDLFAWNSSNTDICPEGGEAMAIRAVFSYLNQRYGKQL